MAAPYSDLLFLFEICWVKFYTLCLIGRSCLRHVDGGKAFAAEVWSGYTGIEAWSAHWPGKDVSHNTEGPSKLSAQTDCGHPQNMQGLIFHPKEGCDSSIAH